MSESRKVQITCPRCQYESPMTVWDSINVELSPALKDKLLDGVLYDWKCEVCGLETRVPYGTMYHDMEHRFMLFFSPWDEDEETKYQNLEVPALSNIGLKDYTFRSVYGMNELREKILIFENGLNDIAIERMKFFLKLTAKNGLFQDDVLLFLGVDMDPEKISSSGWQLGAIKFLKLREGSDSEILPFPMENYYNYLLAVDMDPRMKPAQCSCVDEGWIKMKLQGM